MSWRPILDGDLRERALEAVRDITTALTHPSLELPDQPGIAGGHAGLAMFLAYATDEHDDDHLQEVAGRHFDRAVELVAETVQSAALFTGFTGVAWMVEHLTSDGSEDDADSPASVDARLLEVLQAPDWTGHYGLIDGLCGIAAYALERLPRGRSRQCLDLVARRLEEASVRSCSGITRWTPPTDRPEEAVISFPKGRCVTGLSHGVAGVIGILARMCARDIAVDRARPLLEGAVGWLLAHKRGEGDDWRYPTAIVEDQPYPGVSRVAWCRGDLGIAAALLAAARALGRADWEREAVESARTAARHTGDSAGVFDAGLCHGAAGNGHVFSRIAQATGDPALLAAARFWFERALGLRQPGAGVAGFRVWRPPLRGKALGWEDDPGFLSGAAGIGLALLAATSEVEPSWDRLLLTDTVQKTEP